MGTQVDKVRPDATRVDAVDNTTPEPGAHAVPTAPDGACVVFSADQQATVTQPPPAAAGPATSLGTFGRYELLQELAAGGMGVVYKARDTTLGRIVALKMIRNGTLARPEEVQRFRREAKAAANLRHPHIIDIYEVGQQNGQHYFTMAFTAGGSLDKHLERFADTRAAASLVEKIARAVQHAHEQGVLHRDLKPANVLLDTGDEPRVCDFGLAKVQDSDVELTQTGQFLGTPAYAAPEQAARHAQDVTPAADVWGLGVLLYQLLTGQRPFNSTERDELLRQIRTAEPTAPSELRPGLDPSVEAIVLKCLTKDPAQRYASAREVAEELSRWLQGEPTRERPASALRRWWKRMGRRLGRRAAVALGVVLALLLAAGVAYHHVRAPDEPPPILLIGENGANQPLNWIFGGDRVGAASEPGAPFWFQSSNISAVELLPGVPWERYRLEAQLKHDSAAGFSEIGVFVAHGPHPSAQGVPRSLICVGFGDVGGACGDIQPSMGRIDERNHSGFEGHLFSRMHHFTPAEKTGEPGRMRKLALNVTPQEIRIFFEGDLIGVLPRADIDTAGKHLFRGFPDVQWRFTPQGGLGIYVARGSVSVGRVLIRPLRAADNPR
jgi:tRNA A-37 threonylcarbamoyl transferase component Bud32